MARAKVKPTVTDGQTSVDLQRITQDMINNGKVSSDEVLNAKVLGNCKYLLQPNKVISMIYNRMLVKSEKKRFARLHNRLCQTLMPQNEIFEICMAMQVEEWIDDEVMNPLDPFWVILNDETEKAGIVDKAIDRFMSEKWISKDQAKLLKSVSRYKINQFMGLVAGGRGTREVFDEMFRRPKYFLNIFNQVMAKESLDTDEEKDAFIFDSKLAEDFAIGSYNSSRAVSTAYRTDTEDFLSGLDKLEALGIRSTVRQIRREIDCTDDDIDENSAEAQSIRRVLKMLKYKGLI